MMTKAEARVIAESVAIVRPDWLVTSLTSLLHEFRAKSPVEVHLALLWVAYDPATKTPARIRTEGPWWHIAAKAAHEPNTAPALRPFPPAPKADPAPAEAIAAQRARLARALATTDIPTTEDRMPTADDHTTHRKDQP